MANISTWSTTAADNDASPPDGWPENQAPSTVNDCGREMMAAMRTWYVDSEWANWGHAPTRVDNDTFTVSTDLTAVYHAGRRLKVDGSATGYCTIASSSYGAPNTTVNVTMDSGNLPATLSTVYIAAVSATNSSLPPTFSGTTGTFSGAVTATGFIPTGSTVPANGMYLSAANTVAWASNTTLRGSVNSTGNWVFAAPSSGVAVTVAGVAGTSVIDATAAGVSQIQARNTSASITSYFGSDGSSGYIGTSTNHAFNIYTNNTAKVSVAAAGNVTIAAPSSGVALDVTGVSTGPIANFNNATANGSYIRLQTAGTPIGDIGDQAAAFGSGSGLGITSRNVEFALGTNATKRIVMSSTGNVTINAPSSGATLTVAAASNWAAWTAASAGNSYMSFANAATRGYIGTDGGAIIGSGTGTNFGIRSENDLFLMAGAANRVTVASTGNVTINAASSGDELTVTGSVVATSFAGSLTGDVTGNVTGSSGSCTGNAATATTASAVAAGNITGTTLAAGVTASSLTSVAAGCTIGGVEIGFRGIPQNSQTANYTCVLGDAGKHILHASGAGAGDTFTIPANSSVAYDIGTTITFVNADSNTVSIAINTDTMMLAGTASTGTRTLDGNGVATAIKVGSTSWIISGSGLF